MLILGRKPGWTDDATLIITDRDGQVIEFHVRRVFEEGAVEIAINAPRSIQIDRSEHWVARQHIGRRGDGEMR